MNELKCVVQTNSSLSFFCQPHRLIEWYSGWKQEIAESKSFHSKRIMKLLILIFVKIKNLLSILGLYDLF